MSVICIFSAWKPNFLPVQWNTRCWSSPLEAPSWLPSPCPALALKASEAGGFQPQRDDETPDTQLFSLSECCKRWGWRRGCFQTFLVEVGKRLSPVSGPCLPLSVAQRFGISGPITSWEIDGETMETVVDFIFWGSKITADGDCSHEIKRRLLTPWKKSYDQPR